MREKNHMCMVISGHMMQILDCCSCRDKSDNIITQMRIFCRLLFGLIRIMLEIYNKINKPKNRVLSLGYERRG